jgi:hypothetical protein
MKPFIIIVWLHFLGDFILQSDWMAKNKSDNLNALVLHGLCYGLPFLYLGWYYACVNAGWHMAVDAVTSKITKRLWAAEKRHWFFVVIGLDQAIHLTFLFVFWNY